MRTTLLVLLAASAFAQSAPPPAFDAASVKINDSFDPNNRATWLRNIKRNPGSVSLINLNMTMLVSMAYGIQLPRVIGPDGMDSQRYDIVAKAGHAATDDEMNLMLQNLLVERFKLKMHREKRQMEILAMVMPKAGHKMTVSKVEGEAKNYQDPARGQVIDGVVLSILCDELSREVEIPILDMTGLTGRFDIVFNPQKYIPVLRSRLMAAHEQPPDLEVRRLLMQDVVEGELGLKLEARRAPVEVIVIDHIEKSPIEN